MLNRDLGFALFLLLQACRALLGGREAFRAGRGDAGTCWRLALFCSTSLTVVMPAFDLWDKSLSHPPAFFVAAAALVALLTMGAFGFVCLPTWSFGRYLKRAEKEEAIAGGVAGV